MIGECWNCEYNADTNEVTKTLFDGTTEDPEYFAMEMQVNTLEIRREDGEMIQLKLDRQTVEQGVILFHTMLGLREAARE